MIFFLSVELIVSGRNSTNAKGFLKSSSGMSRQYTCAPSVGTPEPSWCHWWPWLCIPRRSPRAHQFWGICRFCQICCWARQFAPVHHLSLVLDQDGDVHEHLVQLLDRLLQLDEHLVSKEQILGQSLIQPLLIWGWKNLKSEDKHGQQCSRKKRQDTSARCRWWSLSAGLRFPQSGYVLWVAPLPRPANYNHHY